MKGPITRPSPKTSRRRLSRTRSPYACPKRAQPSIVTRVADRIDLSLLGLLVDRSLDVADLVERSRWAEAPAFVPSIEVVERRVVGLVEGALLSAQPASGLVRLTPKGQRRLDALRGQRRAHSTTRAGQAGVP